MLKISALAATFLLAACAAPPAVTTMPQADIAQARAYGITGVPFFVFNGKLGVSGAQAPQTFEEVLNQAVKASEK